MTWIDYMRKYESLSPLESHFQPAMKNYFLQNSVDGLKVFNDMRASESIEISQRRGPIQYEDYAPLIQKVSANYDRRRDTSRFDVPRKVYEME